MPAYNFSQDLTKHTDVDTHRSKWIEYDDYGRPTKSITQNKVDTNFDVIGTNTINDTDFVFLLSKKRIMAGAYIKVYNPVEDSYEYWIASIVYFKSPLVKELPEPLSNRQMLQIDRVATTPGMDSFHLATELYQHIIHLDYVLISDKEQFTGGYKLWKRLSRRSLNDYSVYIYNKEQHQYITQNGQPVQYNSHNIADTEIWKKGSAGRNILLIAHK